MNAEIDPKVAVGLSILQKMVDGTIYNPATNMIGMIFYGWK